MNSSPIVHTNRRFTMSTTTRTTLDDSVKQDKLQNFSFQTICTPTAVTPRSESRSSKVKKKPSDVAPTSASIEPLLKFRVKSFIELVKVEKTYWDHKHTYSSSGIREQTRSIYSQAFYNLLSNSKNTNLIYEYFNLIQFQKCCLLLQSYYSSFEEVNKIYLKTVSNGETGNEQIEKPAKITFTLDPQTNITFEDRMLLYYCTICALYPCFYGDKSLSTVDTLANGDESTMKESSSSNSISSRMNMLMNNNADELETTSEGLCDFVRELFSLERQVFNDYQVKVLKKLLLRKSHAQLVKEDLQKQLFVIENDLHPYYKKENFQSITCYDVWKESTHRFLNESIENFSHVHTSCAVDQVLESKYCDKLKSFVDYYERILNQVFAHLKRINRMSFTSNSKRLLREYQMRYLIDPFFSLLMELSAYLTHFDFNNQLIVVVKNYLNRIFSFLKSNGVRESSSSKISCFPVVIDDLMTLKKLLSCIELSLTFFIKDLKIHYPDAKAGEIVNLVELLEEMCNLNELLSRSSSLTIPELITNSLKDGLSYTYSEIKLKLKIKYFSSSELQFASNLVYSMLHFSREQLIYFKKRIADQFIKYVNIMDIVTSVIYKLLMEDIKCLCEEHKDELKDATKLNLNLLALAYRLNQFDLEWSNIIPVEKQEWRLHFLPQLTNWTMAIGEMCLKTVFNLFIPNDTFNEIKLNDDTSLVAGKIRKSKYRSKTVVELAATKITKLNSETTASPTVTVTSSMSSNTSGVVFSGQSAFKPFKANLADKRASLTNTSSASTDLPPKVSNTKESISLFNDIIVKRHLEDLLDKNRSKTSFRRSKSASCINTKTLLIEKFNRKQQSSLTNIFIEPEAKTGENILFVNSPPPKSFKDTFLQKPANSSRSSTTTTSSRINLELAKTKLSMLRYPCSSSIFDLVVLIFRFKDVCCNLIKFIMPPSIEKMSSRFFEAKFETALCVYRTIFQLIDVYADNLFALDVCATSEPLVNKLFSEKLVNQVFSPNNLDNLWGCRHRLKNSKYNCQYYINRSSQYISDLYEPINEMMCIRLNNLIQIKELYSYLNQIFKTQMQNLKQDCVEKLLKIKSSSTNNGISVNNFKKLIANSIHEQNCIINRITLKINQILNGLIQLLVHRFNLFCKKAILTLMADELDAYPMSTRLKPLTDFLAINFEMLQTRCYQNLFQRILYILWNHFSETFKILLNSLNKTKVPRQSAHKYLQMIDLLMHQFKTYGCTVSFMESKIENLNACLKLYSHESVDLIRLYYKLFNLDYRKSVEMLKKTTSFLLSDLPHLIQMKNQLKKPFNGKYFINYLRKHPPASANMQLFNSKRLDKDLLMNLLINYAQTLLDENYLCSCQPKRKHKMRTSTKPSEKNLMNGDDDEFANELMASFKSNSSPLLNATTTASLNYLNYNTIFLATKLSYFRLNENTINELVNSLLSINTILNHELQILFGNSIRFHATTDHTEPDHLLEICIENTIDYDFIINILWNRIHNEPLVMKFISLRYSNYSTNIQRNNQLSQLYEQQQNATTNDPNGITKDQTVLIPFFFQ